MNELEFKRHLKDLAHGHHHPEEHDWGQKAAPKPVARSKASERSAKNHKMTTPKARKAPPKRAP
jgi:hypothetical protein